MAYTQIDLDRIKRAIATGELTCEMEGKKVTFRSIDELLKAKALIEDELQGSGILDNNRLRRTYASYSKG